MTTPSAWDVVSRVPAPSHSLPSATAPWDAGACGRRGWCTSSPARPERAPPGCGPLSHPAVSAHWPPRCHWCPEGQQTPLWGKGPLGESVLSQVPGVPQLSPTDAHTTTRALTLPQRERRKERKARRGGKHLCPIWTFLLPAILIPSGLGRQESCLTRSRGACGSCPQPRAERFRAGAEHRVREHWGPFLAVGRGASTLTSAKSPTLQPTAGRRGGRIHGIREAGQGQWAQSRAVSVLQWGRCPHWHDPAGRDTPGPPSHLSPSDSSPACLGRKP